MAVFVGSAILLSAFLLFQVEPLIAKLILPWFGGSAAVWQRSGSFISLLAVSVFRLSATSPLLQS